MSSGGRLVVKVHRRVPLVVAEDPLIIEEIVARKKAAAEIALLRDFKLPATL